MVLGLIRVTEKRMEKNTDSEVEARLIWWFPEIRDLNIDPKIL